MSPPCLCMAYTSQRSRATPEAWWSRAQRAPHRIVSLPHRKRGRASAGLRRQAGALEGHGVARGPNVHAVMAWTASKTVAAKETDAASCNVRQSPEAGEG